jgi:RHS repeat-associated protein
VSLTPPGRPAHAFAYTARGQIETFSPPDVGPESGPIAFEYDADRQPTAITFSDGESLAFSYAPSGRLTGMTLPRGTFGYAYGATTGLLDAIATPEGNTLAYDYDGPLITRTTWSGEVAGQVDRSYTADLRLASESVNGGFAIDFSYDADTLPTGVGALALTRDPAHGLVVGATLGVVADTREFNGFAEQTAYEATVDGSAVYVATYVRDAIGRITRKTETVLGTTTVYEYEHDVVGRLTRVVEDDAEAAVYEYDGTGNRLSVARPGGTDTGTYDAQDRLVQYDGATYAHDAAGRVRTRTAGPLVTEHSYDRLGNLLGVTLPDGTDIEYVVDGRGRRVGKRVDGVLVQGFLYRNALQPAAEVDGAGSVVSRFAYVGRHPAFMQRDGATYRILTDHLGSPRLVIDVDTGTVAQRMDYDEFGIVTLDTNPGFQPFGFAGGLYDPQTRLTRFGVRDYDAETGRFTAKEPLKPLEGQDVYAYAANDPVNLIDPFGTDPWDVDWDGPTLEGPLHEEGQPIKERLVQAEQELERLQDRGAARGRNNEGNRALRERVTARIRLLKGQLREIVSRSQRLLNAGGLASKAMCLLAVPEILDLYFRAEENGMTMIEQSEADEAQAVRDGTETFVYMMGPFILVKDVNDPFWGGDA